MLLDRNHVYEALHSCEEAIGELNLAAPDCDFTDQFVEKVRRCQNMLEDVCIYLQDVMLGAENNLHIGRCFACHQEIEPGKVHVCPGGAGDP